MYEDIKERHITLKTWKNKNPGVKIEKWPICAIFGEPITKKQADEIIRRTDEFFFNGTSGNDDKWKAKAKKILNIPNSNDFRPDDDDTARDTFDEWYGRYEEARDAYHKRWQWIYLYHVSNEWISTCNGRGFDGWCHPDGTIRYNQNIGKWPSIEDVTHDLELIAKEFPFLHFFCTIVNHNYDYDKEKDYHFEENPKSIISFEVIDGKVGILSNAIDTKIALERSGYNDDEDTIFSEWKIRASRKAGHGRWGFGEGTISLKHIKKWAKKVRRNAKCPKQ